jgi:hypothetical protein
MKDAKPYGKTNGDISSPVGTKVVESLTRKTGNSLPVNHNVHADLGGGKTTINGPATDGIVKSGFGKGSSYE